MRIYSIRKEISEGKSILDMPLRVTYYSRVSTENCLQKKSLSNQNDYFFSYINDNANWKYVEGYVDFGITGTSDVKRENFMRMIEDAKEGYFDLILTKEISRFSRNTVDSIRYTRELLEVGVFVWFMNDNINTVMPDSELRLTIMASMAQDEIRRLSERVKFGMNRAIERGEVLGHNRLFGYRKDKNTGNLLVVEEEALVVRDIFDKYVNEKRSLTFIVHYLNELGIKTSFGNDWCVSTLSRLIANPKYKGYYCGKKSEVVDYMTKRVEVFRREDWVMYEDSERIPVIISEEVWNLANARLYSRKRNGWKREKYLFQNKFICGKCGKVFYRRVFRRGKRDVSWACSCYLRKGESGCEAGSVRESEVRDVLLELMNTFGIDRDKVSNKVRDFYGIQVGNKVVEECMIKAYMLKMVKRMVVKFEGKRFIYLNIYLDKKFDKGGIWVCSFERGYDVRGAKRYEVVYKVLCLEEKRGR